MSRRAKRLRRELEHPTSGIALLQYLLHVGGISKVGLRKLLKTFGEDRFGLESLDLDSANAAFFESVKHVEDVPLKDGGVFSWEMCHPNLLIASMVRECPRATRFGMERRSRF